MKHIRLRPFEPSPRFEAGCMKGALIFLVCVILLSVGARYF